MSRPVIPPSALGALPIDDAAANSASFGGRSGSVGGFGAPARSASDIEGALRRARALAPRAAALHLGGFTCYLSTLAGLGYADLTTARVVEPHLDAAAILAQAGVPLVTVTPDKASTWGVFAASAPGHHLTARLEDGWLLSGTKPWCSLADRLSHALVTAQGPDGQARLFALDLRHDGVTDLHPPWVARGLRDVETTTLTLTDVPALPVGPPGWYLSRPGFAWGAISVAAIWYGAAAALRTTLLDTSGRRPPDQIALAALGRVDTVVYAAGCVLADVGRLVDSGASEPGLPRGESADEPEWGVLAARVRAVVHDAAETCLRTVGYALGPGPLTGDEDHARRVADLTVYLRQHHADRDLARLGHSLLALQPAGGSPAVAVRP